MERGTRWGRGVVCVGGRRYISNRLTSLGRDEPRRVVLRVGLAEAEARGPALGRLVPHHLGPLLFGDALLGGELLPPRLRLGLWQRLLARQRSGRLGQLDYALVGLRREQSVEAVREQLRVVARNRKQVRTRIGKKRSVIQRTRIEGTEVSEVVGEVVLLLHLDRRAAAALATLGKQRAHIQ